MKRFLSTKKGLVRCFVAMMNITSVITFVLALISLDTQNPCTFVLWVLSGLWLVAYGWANDYIYLGSIEE